MALAPIVLFVYNRPYHTKKTLEALLNNSLASESELYIYADAPKDKSVADGVNEVRNLIDSIDGFKKVFVIKQAENKGLANSIISGVTEVLDKHGKVIVLEDDLVTSPSFLAFMNMALDNYENKSDVFTISGYSNITIPKNYDKKIYLAHISSSWGWATWNDRWSTVIWENEFYVNLLRNKSLISDIHKKIGNDRINMLKMQVEGKIDSWAVRRLFSQLVQKKFTLFPRITLVENIGFDGSGVHCGNDVKFDCKNKLTSENMFEKIPVEENALINKLVYKKNNKNLFFQIIKRLKKIFRG